MKQRHGQQDAVVGLHVAKMIEGVDVRANIAVRKRRAFGKPSRAGSVQDQCGFVGIGLIDLRFGRRVFFQRYRSIERFANIIDGQSHRSDLRQFRFDRRHR